jgi:hypothetical protein
VCVWVCVCARALPNACKSTSSDTFLQTLMSFINLTCFN